MNLTLFKKYREPLVVVGVVLVSLFFAKKAYDLQMAKAWWVKEGIRKEEQKAMTLDRIIVLNERLEKMKEAGWSSTDFASVVDVLTEIGQGAGMRVQDITPMAKTEETHLVTISFFLNAASTYRGVAKFLVAARQLSKVLRVQEVTLSPEKPGDQAGYDVMLKVSLKGEVYYFK